MSSKNLVDTLGSTAGFLEIRRKRRVLLCKFLSYIGAGILLTFGTTAYLDNNFLLATILYSAMVTGIANIILLHYTDNDNIAVMVLNGIMIALSLSLLVTGGSGNTGMLWIYPLVAINLFLNRFNMAIIVSGTFVVLSSILLFTSASELLLTTYSFKTALRFEISFTSLCVICLSAIRAEEKSHSTIIDILSNDIHRLAYYDSLTGLPNRVTFMKNLGRILKRAKSNKEVVALLYIDLDNFKQINDTYGHSIGDQVLANVGEVMSSTIRPSDVISQSNLDMARLAGDEFVIILTDINDADNIISVVERLLTRFDEGFDVKGEHHQIEASIGISVYPHDTQDGQTLLNNADAAMYEAKQRGESTYQFFSQEIAARIEERKNIEDALTRALDENLFSLLLMPIFECQSLEVVGAEVLLRCENPDMQGVGPDRFIPVAESTGLIKRIDEWVIEHAIQMLKELQMKHHFTGTWCINFSGVELHNEDFPNTVKRLINQYQIEPSKLELEITETALVTGDKKVSHILNEIRELGVGLALDDFGTGYTAFNQLIHYPADSLKIDRSFVWGLFSDKNETSEMVSIMQKLAKLYNLRVIAEGVETAEQLKYLQESGCDWAQGYHLSKPIPVEAFIKMIEASR